MASLRQKFADWYRYPVEKIRFLRGKEREIDGVYFYGSDVGIWCTKGAESWIEMPADVVEGIKSGRYGASAKKGGSDE